MSLRKILIFCAACCLLLLLTAPARSVRADSSDEEKISVEISYSSSLGFRVFLRSEKGPNPNLPLSSASIEGKISPRGGGTFEFDGGLEGKLSESGMNLLSRRKVLGYSLLNLLPIADGSPSLVEGAIFEEWEGGMVADIPLARGAIEVFLPFPPDELPRLRVESIDLSKFSWEEGKIEVGFSAKLRKLGGLAVPPEDVYLSGLLESGGEKIIKTASFRFSAGADRNWDFEVPYLGLIYGRTGGAEVEGKLTGVDVEVVMDTIEEVSLVDAPEGYRVENSSYLWTGEEGKRALASLVAGEGDYSISVPEPGVPEPEGGGSGAGLKSWLPILGAAAGLVVVSAAVTWYLLSRKD